MADSRIAGSGFPFRQEDALFEQVIADRMGNQFIEVDVGKVGGDHFTFRFIFIARRISYKYLS